MMAQLLVNIAEKKYESKVEKAFLALCQTFDFAYMAQYLFKNSSYTNKKLASSPKHIIPRIRLIENMVKELGKHQGADA
jgi:hypothetical protein